jgi:nitric oxide reductase subunit C
VHALIGVMAAACSSSGEPLAVRPELVDGQQLFELRAAGDQPGCVTCHSTTPGLVLVGPSLAGVGARAAGRVEGLDAEAYLRQSILDPRAYVVDEFEPGKMPAAFGQVLTDEQVDALVAYLLELR